MGEPLPLSPYPANQPFAGFNQVRKISVDQIEIQFRIEFFDIRFGAHECKDLLPPGTIPIADDCYRMEIKYEL